MRLLPLAGRPSEPLRRMLAIGAHADDLEIGCGGTVLQLLRACPELEVGWIVLAAEGERANEAKRCAEAFLVGASGRCVTVHSFRDGYLPHERAAVKDVFEDLKRTFDPQLVLTHTRDDAHQDHRLASELTWNTFRDHLILEYEIPKWDGDLGRPNVYVPLDADIVARKLELLEAHFPSQHEKHWYDRDTFRGLMRLRGMECVAPSRHAEAFNGCKIGLVIAR
jgi:LmbE family N-acetylglucosaminyl deacetylase